jgi:subtilisin family serine protease
MSDSDSAEGGALQPGRPDLRRQLAHTFIGADLLQQMNAPPGEGGPPRLRATTPPPLDVVIECNASFQGGGRRARLLLARSYVTQKELQNADEVQRLRERGSDLTVPPQWSGPGPEFGPDDTLDLENSFWTDHHLIGTLAGETVVRLAQWSQGFPKGEPSPIYKVWRNHPVSSAIYQSVRTVKCDAAQAAFHARGDGVVWAVADTGIDGSHPHFATHRTLELTNGLDHHDFTTTGPVPAGAPHPALVDTDGHGTHVAGIIAGESQAGDAGRLIVRREVRTSDTATAHEADASQKLIAGLAPEAKLVSLKVLQAGQQGNMGLLLAAIGYVQAANTNGALVKIHGLNLSLGYQFDPRWFAAGQSPLCAEVNRLVKSGVVVVVAAGNAGYGTIQSLEEGFEPASLLGTIEDPGNADLAITVGSTHRDMPHTYGVSYFSAKGPTADGRQKPDLVAPGERIVSCARMSELDDARAQLGAGAPLAGDAPFCERSGTSMAAPHVSGAIAGFLSVRREFLGQPEKVKAILMGSATDLGRRADFQGAGMIDAMRALQSV